MNPFLKDPGEYKRDIDILSAYTTDIATYLARMSGDSYETCHAYVVANLGENGQFPFKDPEIRLLVRDKTGDRHLRADTFANYLAEAVNNTQILSPTLAVYEDPHKKKSLLASYIGINLKKRKKFKHEMFVADMENRQASYLYYDNLQNSCKIKNNSLSGAHASPHTILYNKSSHSTLTSSCRSGTSYANAHNEKFLMGNRHYWSPDVVVANILNIVKTTDYAALQRAMDTYQLHYPTVDETMRCITYSTNLYWINKPALMDIERLVTALTPIERAAFVYTADLYHLAKYNDAVVRQFFSDIIVVAQEPVANAKEIMSGLSSDLVAYVSLLCSDLMDGRLLKAVEKETPHDYGRLAATAVNINNTLEKYLPLIEGLWRPNTLPPSVAHISSMVRRCVMVSDTDSTIFSNQYWCEWYRGRIDFSPTSYAIAYTTTYLTSQIVIHLLAMMSANMGVAPDQIHQLTMKNEYFFPTFTITSRAKHYYALVSAREGNVFKKMKLEVKGVEMKSSNAPPQVMRQLEQYIVGLMEATQRDGNLTIDDVIGPVAAIEHEIIDDIKRGGFKFMRLMQIKDPSSYVDGEGSTPYMHFKLWQEVFAPKYGSASAPPFPVVKISVSLERRVLLERWLAAMPDQELANRLRQWMQENGKDKIGSFLFPQEILELRGIPTEVIPAIDLRKLIYNVMSPYYLVLESLGIYMVNDNITRLVSDTYPAKPKAA